MKFFRKYFFDEAGVRLSIKRLLRRTLVRKQFFSALWKCFYFFYHFVFCENPPRVVLAKSFINFAPPRRGWFATVFSFFPFFQFFRRRKILPLKMLKYITPFEHLIFTKYSEYVT